MDEDSLLATALAVVMKRYMALRTLARDLPIDEHEIAIGPDEIEESMGLYVVVRCDDKGGLSLSLAMPPSNEGDDDGDQEGGGDTPE